MWRDKIARSLKELGVPPENWQVLKLLPLVYTAWADGELDKAERDKILDYAQERLQIGREGHGLLLQWLTQCPSRQYVVRGLEQLLRLANAPDEPDLDVADLQTLLVHCEEIARAATESVGYLANVCPAEESAIKELSALLRVDSGRSWSELLREIDGSVQPRYGA